MQFLVGMTLVKALNTSMSAFVKAKNSFLRSDGLYFITADSIEGNFQKGDVLVVPKRNLPPIRIAIDLVIHIANKTGNQQSLAFKNLSDRTIETLELLIGYGDVLTIENQ